MKKLVIFSFQNLQLGNGVQRQVFRSFEEFGNVLWGALHSFGQFSLTEFLLLQPVHHRQGDESGISEPTTVLPPPLRLFFPAGFYFVFLQRGELFVSRHSHGNLQIRYSQISRSRSSNLVLCSVLPVPSVCAPAPAWSQST